MAGVFMVCEDFRNFGTAYYHSTVHYTTLRYGDLIVTNPCRVLGPLEAANRMVMFGVTTALVFAVIQQLLHARFVDLRD